MSRDELQVIPEDLAGKANQIRGLSFTRAAAQPALTAPDALDTSAAAIANLAVNAESIWAYQEFGRLEGLRLAQTLEHVAAAYTEMDEASGKDLDSTVGGSGSPGASDGTRYPREVDLPAPPHPPTLPVPKGELPSEQLLFPPATQRALETGDAGASLRAAAQMWRGNADALQASAGQFETNSLRWEGEAADAAYAKFHAYRDWLIGLAGSWERLAGEADRIVDAHSAARRDHKPIAEDFERLQQEIRENPASADNLRKTVQMAALQNQSEELRNRYAREGQPFQVQPADPPSPVVGAIPVTVDDHRRSRRALPNEHPGQLLRAPARDDGSRAGGQPHDLMPASQGVRAQQSGPRGADSPAAGIQGGGAPSGGPQGGGSPGAGSLGAGSPGAGSLGPGPLGPGGHPGARPTGPNTRAHPFAEPSLRPATSGAAASPTSGAGAGATPTSLQPAVGAETVAPMPVVTPVAPPMATAGSASSAAGMGGAMGGMAPMMHGAKGDGTGEKRRNPQLSVDKKLYSEDRPWTEAVIGNRTRRRGTPDGPAPDRHSPDGPRKQPP